MRLDDHGREIAAQAWEHARPVVRRYDARLPGPDYRGFVALRISASAASFDPDVSSLPAWACRQARWACQDARRDNHLLGAFRTGIVGRPPRVFHVGECDAMTTEDPESPMEQQENILLLTRGLLPVERGVLLARYRDDMTFAEIGRVVGHHESWVLRIHNRAIEFIRSRPGIAI